jgi:ATP-dependent Clp protease protease subunit
MNLTRSYNPIERGQPAIWLDDPIIGPQQVSRLMRSLREYPLGEGPVDIVVDGNGGRCSYGLEMYTLLREHPRRKRVTIVRAASMSALIAMAGDEIRIIERGTMMIHDAGIGVDQLLTMEAVQRVPAAALRNLAKACDASDLVHRQIYARRTGLPAARIADLSAAETWFDAERAVELGFADEIVKPWAAAA